jgi:hypothetical protein
MLAFRYPPGPESIRIRVAKFDNSSHGTAQVHNITATIEQASDLMPAF